MLEEAPGRIAATSESAEREPAQQLARESAEHRSRKIQLSAEIAQETAGATTPDEFYHRLVKLVKERLGYYHAQIYRHDQELNALVLIEGYGEAGARMKAAGHRLPYGRGVVGTAASTGEAVLAPDLIRDSYWVPHPELPETKGELAVPIKLGNRLYAVLDVQSDTARALTKEDRAVLLSLASQVSVAIQGLRQLEATLARARREQILREIGTQVRAFADPDAVARMAVRELGTALGRPAFIRLGSTDELSRPPTELEEGDRRQKAVGGRGQRPWQAARRLPTEGGE